ncbi:MAG: acyl-ACP--UDP-N-acetylglucosamine O-acyltransferase [Bacteroidales bacterium]|nr:acyl-ACP--UDP-N-acetylglucosamine O-acyltransferase [Bacteroidales bacterium]
MIHKLTEIHPGAILGKDVNIGPFCVVDDDVVIGDGTTLISHVHVMSGARIGKNCRIFPGAVIGAVPQDLKFVGEYTTLELGDNNTIRECVTLNRGTASKGKTVIGSNNLIMAYCHVGHDCVLGNHIVISNDTQIAGEVTIDDWAVIGGNSAILQFSNIGKHCMISGKAGVMKDVPPYVRSAREPIQYSGINIVGLTRRGFSQDTINTIHDCYRIIYQQNLNTTQALTKIEEEIPQCEERDEIINFIKKSKHGIIRGPK